MAYSVARTDNLMGTDVRSALVSVKYIKNNAPMAIENGHVLKVGDLLDSEREIFAGVDVAANDKLAEVVLVVGPELLYNELKRRLDDYINVAGEPARAYRLHNGDTFSVTKDALAGAAEPAVGDVVELAAGTKLNVAAKAVGATEGSTVVGRIIHIEDTGTYVYYTVLVVEGGEATEAGDSLPAVTSDDDGDVLTVVDGAWAKAAPSGNSGILVANIIDQQEEPYNTIINKTFAELAAADVVILRYIAAGDPLDPSSEFTVCCTIANVIANANSALAVVYDNELMLGQVGVSTFVASSVNDYPVAFGSEP